MDKVEFANRRMHQHRLWGKPFAAPEETLRWFGVMQAQEFVPAKWAIAQRAAATDDSAIEKLYVSGAILRTHVLRPTWHFVHRDDIRWALEATRARVLTRIFDLGQSCSLKLATLGGDVSGS